MSNIETVTIKSSNYNHPDFRMLVDSVVPRVDVDAIVSFLEYSVRAGTRFEDGQTIELGSMLLRLG